MRIVCLTEEPVEILYALGRQDTVIGVSSYAKRPASLSKEIPRIGLFQTAKTDIIKELNPDLVIGYSDIQAEIAKDLTKARVNTFISHHNTIEGIFEYVLLLGRIVDRQKEAKELLSSLNKKINEIKRIASQFKKRPTCYIEEWDEPRICGSPWFCEILEICGFDVIHREKSLKGHLGSERIIEDQDIINSSPKFIFASWCGKKVKIDSFKERENWNQVDAVINNRIFELDSTIFLQPGIAPIVDGLDIIMGIMSKYQTESETETR